MKLARVVTAPGVEGYAQGHEARLHAHRRLRARYDDVTLAPMRPIRRQYFGLTTAFGIVLTFVGVSTFVLAVSGMPIGRCPPGETCGDIAPHAPSRTFVAVTGALMALPGVLLLVLGRKRR